jgi:hypothetical protein
MRFAEEGGWRISTPVYLGSASEVEKAMTCAHVFGKIVHESELEDHLVQTEKCDFCVAIRTRMMLL